jgi:hypothetical protein
LQELHENNELRLERFGVGCFAYVAFGGVVSQIQIDMLFEQMWALDHFTLVKVAVGQKAL